MKHFYLTMTLLFFCTYSVYAQPCPDQGGTTSSGGTQIFFSYSTGVSSCASRPTTIIVDGSSTFELNVFACTEGTSQYLLQEGSDPIIGQDFVVTSGFDSECSYNGGTLPVDEFILNENLNLYPNPLKEGNIITLSFGFDISGEISVYNITGKREFQFNINGIDKKEIDFSNLANGIYMLQIATDNVSITKKIVIMK